RRRLPRPPLFPYTTLFRSLIGLGVETAAKLVRMQPPTTRRLLVGKTHKVIFDCARAKQVLGWSPEVSWTEGLERNVAWASRRNRYRPPPVAIANGHQTPDVSQA